MLLLGIDGAPPNHPSERDVEVGTVFGSANEFTGSFVAPPIARVAQGETFGDSGEFVGTLSDPASIDGAELVKIPQIIL